MLYIFYGLVVPFHTDIGQQADVVEKIGKFLPGMLEKLDDGTGFFPPKNNFDDFVALVIGTLITHIINFCSPILNFKFEGVIDVIDVVLIKLSVEKLLEDDGLVASQGKILAADEGREESEMFGGHVTFG